MKQFFLDFAAKKGFDPYEAQNWRKVTYKELSKNGNFVRDRPSPCFILFADPHLSALLSTDIEYPV